MHSAALRTWVTVLALVYVLLIGVTVVGDGFKWVTGGTAGAAEIFAFASNPVVGVILGVLATGTTFAIRQLTRPTESSAPAVRGRRRPAPATGSSFSLGQSAEPGTIPLD